MGRLPDNFVTVKERIGKLRAEYGLKATIETSISVDGDMAVVKATLSIDGKLIATAHSRSDISEEKGLEKGETVAVGRALEYAGYVAVDAEKESEEQAQEERPAKRLGRSPEKETSPTKRVGRTAAPQKEEIPETAEDSETQETEEELEASAEEPQEAAPAPAPAAPKMSSRTADLMAKYKSGKSNTETSSLRR